MKKARTSHCLLIALAISSGALDGCCADESDSVGVSGEQARSRNNRSTGTGLFVIDGTGETWDRNTVVSRLEKMWDGTLSRYQPGLQGPGDKFLALGAARINDEILHTTICPAIANKALDQVFLAGYSRGAIMALGLAVDIMEKNKCGKKPEKLWLGMVDAVNIPMLGWPTKVPDGVKAIHIVKRRTEPVADGTLNWPTATIGNVRKIVAKNPTVTHSDIGWEDDVLSELMQSASRAGGSFKSVKE